jgi:hypothetical protein
MPVIVWWRDEIARSPAMAGVLLVWLINASMNAAMGHTIGGGGYWGSAIGAVFVAVAALGSYAAHAQASAVGYARSLLLLMVAFQLVLGQIAGWQSLGLTLDRGATQLETQATGRASVQGRLDRARAERQQIGTVRPASAVEADERLECSRVSRQFPTGEGPRCTAFRVELATARRAEELDRAIPQLVAELRAAGTVGNAQAGTQVPEALSSAVATMIVGERVTVTAEQVRFALLVFLVAVLEFIATLGPGLFSSQAGASGHRGPGGGNGRRSNGFDAAPGPHGAPDARGAAVPMRDAVQAVMGGPWPALPAPAPVVALPGGGTQAMHAAPINIYLDNVAGRGAGEQLSRVGVPPHLDPAAAAPLTLPSPGFFEAVAGRRERLDLPALPADAPPVDRSKVRRPLTDDEREAADVILAFRAACVPAAPGGVVSGEHLFRRYQAWAGTERALGEEAFEALFADLTGVERVEIGGLGHWRGIALRAAPGLKAVA